MIPLGLKADDKRALHDALISTGRVSVHVDLSTLDHTPLGSLNDFLLDGQVDVDNSQPVTRELSMVLMERRKHLPFDTDSPSRTALWMDRMITVRYRVIVNGDWMSIPVFTGPVTWLQRSQGRIELKAKGKEFLAMGNVWPPYTIGKNIKKTDAIQKLLIAAGEVPRRLFLPDLPARTAHDTSLHRVDKYWPEARSIAHSINRQLFYDGNGDCRMRTHPGHQYTFNDGKHILGEVQIEYNPETVANTVMIVGAKPKGAKKPIISIRVAPATHPLSPLRLGRNGVPRHILLTGAPIHMPHVKTQADADDIADQKLEDALLEQVNATFNVIAGAVALLDPGDLCHLNTGDLVLPFRLNKFSLPLRDGGSASVGYHKNVSVRRPRRHHPHHKSRKSGHK